MKIISKIFKQPTGGWVGQCADGEIVSLSTKMSNTDVFKAKETNRTTKKINNIWKVIVGNRYMPLGHKLGGYTTYEGTSVSFWG